MQLTIFYNYEFYSCFILAKIITETNFITYKDRTKIYNGILVFFFEKRVNRTPNIYYPSIEFNTQFS